MRARLLALLSLTLVPALAAQGHPAQAPDGALFEGIVLTAEQRGQVDSIWSAHGPMGRMAMPAADHAGHGCGPAAQGCASPMETHAAMHQQLQTAYREVLTPEQRPVFDRNAEGLGAGGGPCPGMGAGHPGGHGGSHPRHGQ
jgi:hypothetical protein